MTEFTILEEDPSEKEPEWPSYSDPGRILFEIHHIYRCGDEPWAFNLYEIEVIDYDSGSSIMWLNEGQGIECWLNDCIDLEETGFYVLEGVTGEYIRGDGWTTDDDEEWDFVLCRRATEEEIRTGALT